MKPIGFGLVPAEGAIRIEKQDSETVLALRYVSFRPVQNCIVLRSHAYGRFEQSMEMEGTHARDFGQRFQIRRFFAAFEYSTRSLDYQSLLLLPRGPVRPAALTGPESIFFCFFSRRMKAHILPAGNAGLATWSTEHLRCYDRIVKQPVGTLIAAPDSLPTTVVISKQGSC